MLGREVSSSVSMFKKGMSEHALVFQYIPVRSSLVHSSPSREVLGVSWETTWASHYVVRAKKRSSRGEVPISCELLQLHVRGI